MTLVTKFGKFGLVVLVSSVWPGFALAGVTSTIPVTADVQGVGEVEIGTIEVDDNGGAGGGISGVFEFGPGFGFLDAWYEFRWINIVTGYTIGGASQDGNGNGTPDAPIPSSANEVDLPAVDPQPGPCAGCPPFNDASPFYFTDAEQAACAAAEFGVICVPGVSSSFSDDRANHPAGTVITFETYLVVQSQTDDGLDPMTVCVLAGFEWTYDQNTGAQTQTLSIVNPSADNINAAMGQAAPPGFAGWSATTDCTLSECPSVTDCVYTSGPGVSFSESSWTLDGEEIGKTFEGGISPVPGLPIYDDTYLPDEPNDWHWYVDFEWEGIPIRLHVWVDNFDAADQIEVEVICSPFFLTVELMLMVDVNNDTYQLQNQEGSTIWQGQWSQYPNDIPPSLGFTPTGDKRQNYLGPPPPCPWDLNGDGVINAADLALLLGAWGPHPSHPADFNGDGFVDAADLAPLLGHWGPCPAAPGCTTGFQCSDGSVCNGIETCVDGMCRAGDALDCDDHNPCTNDACDAKRGCSNMPDDSNSCEDGAFCSGPESCSGGSCQSAGDPCASQGLVCDETNQACVECLADGDCPAGMTCNLATQQCVECKGDDDCDAGTVCNTATGQCVECLTDAQCEDGQYCTGSESCTDGSCQSTGDPCTDRGLLCDEINDICSLERLDFLTTCPEGCAASVLFGAADMPPIPPDFFDPGSEPFLGAILLRGDALDLANFGSTDTIIRRFGDPLLPSAALGSQGTVPIQLAALRLVSCEPITVVNNQQPDTLWNLEVALSPTLPSLGTLTATKTHANGGTFSSLHYVQPLFVFTEAGNPSNVRVLDTGAAALPPLQIEVAPIENAPWVIELDDILAVLDAYQGNFHPGVEEVVPADPSSQEIVPLDGASQGGGLSQSLCPTRTAIDPWATCQEGASTQFGPPEYPPIPADFFYPGSDPFVGTVVYQGEPLGATPFGNFDVADTLVRRIGDPFDRAELPGYEIDIPIEIVALNLTSIQPITITTNGGKNPDPWDVRVNLSDFSPSPPGSLTARKTHANGGTWDSTLPLQARFTFTQVLNPSNVRILDTGQVGIPPIILRVGLSANAPWVHDLDPNLNLDLPGCCTDFHPGIEETVPGDISSQQVVPVPGASDGGGMAQTVCPPQQQQPPASDCCVVHNSPGCDTPTCAAQVCNVFSPHCCFATWGPDCVQWAVLLCPVCQ